ncbi:hypothetical protein [Cyclobacterium jeungdonense]|uniref:Uncharacterized protein n=1 Tax=Cyclobacterium jeungdonense TaxID=708087 RepID=A0ABT8C152_9BACT|nr:hypothetical protein [Cyclobacterium jeungdonense]MDN3686210.1 hypothetical protein [Cyclobacterium jeungdonense]
MDYQIPSTPEGVEPEWHASQELRFWRLGHTIDPRRGVLKETFVD